MWAGPQQSETHRGLHRRGVAAGGGRAAHCYQGHGARPEAPGPALGTKPSHSHTDSPCPAGPGRRERSHQGLAPPRGRPLKGQTPLQPSRWSQHQVAAAAPPFSSPQFCPPRPHAPPSTLGAEPGRGRKCKQGAQQGRSRWYVGTAAFCLRLASWPLGFRPPSPEAHLALPSLPRPVRSPELCFGSQLFSYPAETGPRETGVGGHRSWIGSDAVRLKWGGGACISGSWLALMLPLPA